MGKKKLSPQLKGLVAKLVAKISYENEINPSDGYLLYIDDLTDSMKKYDLENPKDEIIEDAKKKYEEKYGEPPSFDDLPTKAKENMHDRAREEVKNRIPRSSVPNRANLVTLPSGERGYLKDPTKIKVKGTAHLLKTDFGTMVKATEETKKLFIECDEESKGVKLSEDEGGCFVPEGSFRDYDDLPTKAKENMHEKARERLRSSE